MNKKVTTLSGGQQRKLSIVVMMLLEPKVIILDEPSAGMDRSSVLLFREDLKKLNDSLKVLTSHNVEDLLVVSDEILFLKDGKIEASLYKQDFDEFSETYDSLYIDAETVKGEKSHA